MSDTHDSDTHDDERQDDGVAPEVPTSFATKGVGWSGRESDGPDVVDLNGEPPKKRSTSWSSRKD